MKANPVKIPGRQTQIKKQDQKADQIASTDISILATRKIR